MILNFGTAYISQDWRMQFPPGFEFLIEGYKQYPFGLQDKFQKSSQTLAALWNLKERQFQDVITLLIRDNVLSIMHFYFSEQREIMNMQNNTSWNTSLWLNWVGHALVTLSGRHPDGTVPTALWKEFVGSNPFLIYESEEFWPRALQYVQVFEMVRL